jgi:hypothetical protein
MLNGGETEGSEIPLYSYVSGVVVRTIYTEDIEQANGFVRLGILTKHFGDSTGYILCSRAAYICEDILVVKNPFSSIQAEAAQIKIAIENLGQHST